MVHHAATLLPPTLTAGSFETQYACCPRCWLDVVASSSGWLSAVRFSIQNCSSRPVTLFLSKNFCCCCRCCCCFRIFSFLFFVPACSLLARPNHLCFPAAFLQCVCLSTADPMYIRLVTCDHTGRALVSPGHHQHGHLVVLHVDSMGGEISHHHHPGMSACCLPAVWHTHIIHTTCMHGILSRVSLTN